MKYILLLLITFQTILMSSCNKNDDDSQNNINKSELIGQWNLTDVIINNKEPNDKGVVNAHSLVFYTEQDYYRTYISGTWELNKNIIELDAVLDSSDFDWDMEIIEITPSILKVKMKLRETAYGWNFEEYGSDEVLEIIETYEKHSDQ